MRTPHSFLPEFETGLDPDEKLMVEAFSKKLSDFFVNQWSEGGMPEVGKYTGQNRTFNVAGFNEGESY